MEPLPVEVGRADCPRAEDLNGSESRDEDNGGQPYDQVAVLPEALRVEGDPSVGRDDVVIPEQKEVQREHQRKELGAYHRQ